MLRRWRIKQLGDGRYRFNVSDDERQVVRSLLGEFGELLSSPPESLDDRVRRIFPTAYADDPERDAEYQRFMREELVASHLSAIEQVNATLEQRELSEAELHRWVQGINALRLVLGTMLDVSEDDDPMAFDDPGHTLYAYLSGLLEEMIQALSGAR
jgi:hypothetical protein